MKTVYIIHAESMGRGDDTLGVKLMSGFLRTLTALEPKPDALVFYNAAVKMLDAKSTHLEALKELDHAGVDLLACVTCLEFYGLTDKLAVGHVSNMREICQRLAAADKTITI